MIDNARESNGKTEQADLENAMRLDILRAMKPEDVTQEQRAELEAAEFVRIERASQDTQGAPTTHLDEEGARQPTGASKDQHDLVTERNQELLDGAEAGPEGEREVGVGKTVSSSASQATGAPD